MMAIDGMSPWAGVLTATVAAANIIAVPLVAIAMPLAALAAIASLIWPPLGEVIAAPAALAATALIRTIDVLGAPEANVGVGVPPLPAAAVIAATASVLLLLIAGGAFRWVRPFQRIEATGSRVLATTGLDQGLHVKQPGQPEADPEPLPVARDFEPLPSPALLVFTREDPLDSPAADPDKPEEEPTGEEVGHELANERQAR
jgi:hypothetical protein